MIGKLKLIKIEPSWITAEKIEEGLQPYLDQHFEYVETVDHSGKKYAVLRKPTVG